MTIHSLTLSTQITSGPYACTVNSVPLSIKYLVSTIFGSQTDINGQVTLANANGALKVGQLVTGVNVQPNTYISVLNADFKTFTLSQPPLQQLVNVVLTFYNVTNDYSNVSFNINWDNIFKEKTGEAILKFQLCSNSGIYFTFNDDIGNVRLNGIASPYSNELNLGLVKPTNDPNFQMYSNYNSTTGVTTYASPKNYLYGSSLESSGVTVKIPQGNQTLNIQLLNFSDSTLGLSEHYKIWLFFEVKD